MRPTVFGFDAWLLFWSLGAGVGTLVNFSLARRNGLPRVRSALALGAMGLVGLVGARVQFRVDLGLPLSGFLGNRGTRMAGGMLALAVISPLVLRVLRLPIGRLLDLIVFGALVAMTVGRFGCLLAGCCFGTPTNLPWGVSFPAGSLAYHSHVFNHIVSPNALRSAPVHPLQVYFAATTASIAGLLLWLRRRASRDGEVFVWFLFLRSWATVALESLRGMDLASPNNGSRSLDLFVALLVTPVWLVLVIARVRGVLESTSPGTRVALPAFSADERTPIDG